jgi:hypothetical protein
VHHLYHYLRLEKSTYADGGLSGAFSSGWVLVSGCVIAVVFMGLTLGCRLYLRLLPVVARGATLFPMSGPGAEIVGEQSCFIVVLTCSMVGSTMLIGCDRSLR